MSSILEEFTEDSLYLKFKPLRDANGEWRGDIDISAIIHDDHGLSYEELSDMMHVLQMVCASVPLFEEDEEVREKARKIVERAMALPDDEYTEYMFGTPEEQPVKKPTITTEGNVVTLKFNNE